MIRIQALSLSCIFILNHALAQKKVDSLTYELEEVTISETYLAKKRDPLSFQNVSIELLESKNIGQEPSFILSSTPSITVYSDAGSYHGYSYFRLRGIDQTRVNMTLDGVPLNEPEDQGAYFSNYPDFLNSVSSIQIQRGTGTTKNGSASYAGSIDFSSPRLFDESSSTNFGAGYGSFGSYRLFGEHKSRYDNKSIYLRATNFHSDGYKYRSSNDSKSIFYAAGVYGKKNKFKLIGFAGNQQNELAWLGVSESEIELDPRSNANTNEDDEFTQSHTQIQHQYVPNDNILVSSSIYYNFLKGNYDFDLNNFLGFPSTDEMLNYALKSHFIGILSNLNYRTERLDLTVGIHVNNYARDHIGSERSAGQLYENTGYKDEYSAFGKLSVDLSPKLLIFTDLQYRYTSFDYQGSVELDKMSWNFFNPTAGITFMPSNDVEAYYSVGRTGREPTRTDIFGGWDDLQSDENNDPILFIVDPEYVIDHELGIRLNKPFGSLSVNLFHMSFDNEIVLNGQFGPNGLALNSNVDKSFRRGIELNFITKEINSFVLETNLSFNDSEIKQQSETFEPILTPSVILNQDIMYTKNKFEVALEYRYQSSSYIDFANENEVNDYMLLNARASYKLNRFKFSAFINNLTNTQYFSNGYVDFDGSRKLFVQAPRNYYGLITYSF